MRALFNLKNIAVAAVLGFAAMSFSSADVSAQSRRESERERERIERQNARYQRERQRRYRTSRNDDTVVSRQAEQRIANANYTTGYQQGLMAGQFDRRRGKYNQSNVYRETGAYPNDGDPTSNDYIYRQGYLQGYTDGFNGIRNY